MNGHVLALSGGVGGAKLAAGLCAVLPPERLTVLLAYQGYGCFAVVWGNLANMVGATLLCFMAGERDWMASL